MRALPDYRGTYQRNRLYTWLTRRRQAKLLKIFRMAFPRTARLCDGYGEGRGKLSREIFYHVAFRLWFHEDDRCIWREIWRGCCCDPYCVNKAVRCSEWVVVVSLCFTWEGISEAVFFSAQLLLWESASERGMRDLVCLWERKRGSAYESFLKLHLFFFKEYIRVLIEKK